MSFAAQHSGIVTRLYRWLWVGHVRSPTPALPPGALIFAAHYNGMIDAATFGSELGAFIGVVSVQWHKNLLGRFLLPGIAVKRAKDRVEGFSNTSSFRAMLATLRGGDRLLFFPEGTSRLGQERLPVQPGTLLLLRTLRSSALNPPVYFTAAHYHEPTLWRSAVSLGWIGPLTLPTTPATDETWVRGNLLAAQALAYAMPVPPPRRLVWLGALLALPYLPWWVVTAWLARRTADEDNVIALWKFIFGVPLTLLAFALYTALGPRLGVPWCVPTLSLLGGWLCWSL